MHHHIVRVAEKTEQHLIDQIDQEMGFSSYPEVLTESLAQNRILIALVDHQAVGYLRYGFLWEQKLPYIQMIRITQAYQHQGLGRQLVVLLEKRLVEAGIHRLLSSTDETNHSSIKFHQALGFEECGKLSINEHREVEIFFLKELA